MIKILIISGPSGSGKSTLINRLISQKNEFKLVKSVTDRRPRSEGELYTFVSAEEFKNLQNQEELLESNVYATGHHYGTPLSEVCEIMENNQIPVLDIDVNGREQVLKKVKKWIDCKVISIFVAAPAEAIQRRLINRQTESMEEIIERLKRGAEETRRGKQYDIAILNDELELGVDRLYKSYLHCIGKSVADGDDWKLAYGINDAELDRYASELLTIATELDDKNSISSLSGRIEQFCTIRGWLEKNTAKDLAIGVSTEANELLDIFRFKTEEQVKAILETVKQSL